MSRPSAIEELTAAASRPFENALAMPPSVYTSEEFLQAELDGVFGREWVCVGRAESLKKPGDYVAYDLAGQPILVLRDKDGTLGAVSNVCLHRMSTMLEGCGNAKAIVCPYHGWTYNLDGSLRGAPFMHLTDGFRRTDYRLPRIRCEEWLGWVYVTLDPDRPSVSEDLAPLEAMISQYGMENYIETFRETHVWDTNWKVLAENFMESYHLPVCHAGTIGPLHKLEEMDCPPGLKAFNYHWIIKDATLAIGNAHPDNTRLVGDWRKTTALMAIYPSHLVTLTPGYFWYLSLHPHGPGKVHITFGGGLSPDFVHDAAGEENIAQLKRLLDKVNIEDRGCTEKVYRGLSAALARPGHLSYLERPIYDFMQYLAERTGGFQRRFAEAAE